MFPKMSTKSDQLKAIAALVTIVLSVVFVDKYDDIPVEVVSAITTVLAYIIGLYSERTKKSEVSDNEQQP